MKEKNKALSILLTGLVTIASIGVMSMFVNLLFHYLLLAIRYLAYSAGHGKVAPDYGFSLAYLFQPPHGLSWYAPLMLTACIVILTGRKTIMRISHRIFTLFPGTKSDVEGSSRWATTSEIRKYLTAVLKTDIGQAEKGGIVLASDKNNYYVDTQTVNSFIIGTTRSGKSQLSVLNTIRLISQCKHPQSFVAFDLKGELVESSYEMLHKKGYRIHVFNLDNPALSSRRNQLAHIIEVYVQEVSAGGGDYSHAIELTNELSQMITDNPKSDPIWPTCAKSLLSAMILYLLEDGYKRECLGRLNLYSVYNFFIEYGGRTVKIGKQIVNALDALMSALPIGHPAKMSYASSKFADGEMRSSIFSTLASNLELFSDSGIAYLSSGNEIDFKELADPDHPCAIFMVVPDDKKSRFRLATIFVTQCYEELMEISRNYPRKMLPQRVHFILDEFGNMPAIPDLSTKITTCLGHNVLFELFVQSMAQLEDKYGRFSASTIQGNCGNWVYLNSLDKDTNKYISDQLGPSTQEYNTYNADNGDILDKTKMMHYKSRTLKMPDELMRLEYGELIVIRQRCYPILTKLQDFYELKIPVRQLEDVMPRATISLQDILYPLEELANPVPEAAATQKTGYGEARTDRIKLQAVINNANILTQGRFSKALEAGEWDTLRDMVRELTAEQRLSEDQRETLNSLFESVEQQ